MKKIIIALLLLFFLGNLHAVTLETNDTLRDYRIAKSGSSSVLLVVDGMVDVFLDESGIDTEASMYESHSAVTVTNDSGELLLHLDGTDGATFTNNSGTNTNTITFHGDAQLRTAEKKSGDSSLFLDGNGDYISIADSSDWDIVGSNSEDWTISLWVKLSNWSDSRPFIGQSAPGSIEFWRLSTENGRRGIVFDVFKNSTYYIKMTGSDIRDNEWHHVAVVIKGLGTTKDIGMYLDGNQTAYARSSYTTTFAYDLDVGQAFTSQYFYGYIDEVRLQRGNVYNASPNPEETDTLTMPVERPPGFYYMPEPDSNMTLISKVYTAKSNVTEAKIVIFEEDIDPIDLETDIKVYISRDGESNPDNFEAVPLLVDEGFYENNKRVISGVLNNFVNSAEDNKLRFKIETLNNKNLLIHGVGLSWGNKKEDKKRAKK